MHDLNLLSAPIMHRTACIEVSNSG